MQLMSESKRFPLFAVIVGAFMMAMAVVLAYVLIPRNVIADALPPITLNDQVPKAFGGWREDPYGSYVLPDPGVQRELDALYSQVLTRTYVNDIGQRVMLTIAYGKDQNSEATAAHRPEFCYRAQGFAIKTVGVNDVQLLTGRLKVMQLIGTSGSRVEPISYWVTLADKATLPGWGRKLSQIAFGLQGKIADGMLVRVSTIDPNQEHAFKVQQSFLQDMAQAIPESLRPRYFGS